METMKVLVFVFGLFFFFLSIVPCYCDELGSSTDVQTEHIHQSDDQQHTNSGDAVCTPFCHCSNFHHPNFFEETIFSSVLDFTLSPKYSLYTESSPFSVVYGFWRPPQL